MVVWAATLESNGHVRVCMAAVRDAVIVAGGVGARMLPATAAVAKEMLPLVDIPAITHLAREAVAAGAERLHIITSPSKNFDQILGDNTWLSQTRPDIKSELISPFGDVEVLIHIQHTPRGFGDALSCALSSISGPFMVLLGDNILLDSYSDLSNYKPSNASRQLVEKFNETSLPCVGLISVHNPEDYGVVTMSGNFITQIVEKPPRESAPTNLVLCGRYIFTEDTSDLLSKYSFEQYGELQSIAIQKHWMDNSGLIGVELEGYQWYDSGLPIPWLKGQIDYALRREDLAEEIREWLIKRLQR